MNTEPLIDLETDAGMESDAPDTPGPVTDGGNAIEDTGASPGANRVPEDGYQLTVPESLAGTIEADPDDPRVEQLFEVAQANNWSQDMVDQVVALEYANLAAGAQTDAQVHAQEKAALVKSIDPSGALGEEAALHKAAEYGRWAVDLLAGDMKANPGLMDELKFLTTTANGVALLKAFRDHTQVGGVPRPADATTTINPFAKDTFNLTVQSRIARDNPELAESLKAQARRV